MKTLNFAKRNMKELLREPLSLIFCIVMPLLFLIIFQQFNIQVKEFSIEYFAPGIVIFSYSFIALFTAQLISNDRTTSLLTRLFASPMKSSNYILGYTISLFPLVILQNILFFIVAVLFGLNFNIHLILTVLILIPISLLFIAIGILIGTISSEKQSSALSSLIIQLVSFTSGMWFPINLAGKIYKFICEILPFSHSLNLARTILNDSSNNILLPLFIILIYTFVIFVLAIIMFNKKMTSDNN